MPAYEAGGGNINQQAKVVSCQTTSGGVIRHARSSNLLGGASSYDARFVVAHQNGFMLGHVQNYLRLFPARTTPAWSPADPFDAHVRPEGHKRYCSWISPTGLGISDDGVQDISGRAGNRGLTVTGLVSNL